MGRHKETGGKRPSVGIPPGRASHRCDRFHTLLALAREGNGDAIGDLWREFAFDFHREDAGHE